MRPAGSWEDNGVMSVTAAKGFLASGIWAGIKRSGKPDFSLIVSARPAAAAGVFTANRFRAVPVEICIKRLKSTGGRASAVIATSGCANAMTGRAGERDALALASAVSRVLGVPGREVLVASTGAIGRTIGLDRARILRAVRLASKKLGAGPESGNMAARGIMTTDTRPKQAVARFRDGGTVFTVGGMAKGVGMVAPKMATILVFMTTDARVAPGPLRSALREAVAPTLNSISVDGQMSTNDTCLLLANGFASRRRLSGAGLGKFHAALRFVCGSLARQLVEDGEGATKLIEVEVRGARTPRDARAAARAVADSTLVKTAMYGAQANWGRIASALGACEGIAYRPSRVRIWVAGKPAVRNGMVVPPGRGAEAALRKKLVKVDIDLGAGRHSAKILTCDLTEGYIKENAGYLT